MVPPEYDPEDAQNLTSYVSNVGSAGRPLLDAISTDLPSAMEAQERLYEKIHESLDYMTAHYTKIHADGEEAVIHYAKFNHGLLDFLEERGLAWPTESPPERYGHRKWFGTHPTLGNAIMSTIATSVAAEKGWPIVTPDVQIHENLIGITEEEIFHRITNISPPTTKDGTQDTANELGELVINTTLNLNALRIDDIIELQKEKKDLRRFRDLLVERVQRIGSVPDHQERARALEPLGEEIKDEWNDYKKALPRRVAETLFGASNVKLPELAATLLSGASGKYLVGTAEGLAVLMLTYSGMRVYKEHQERSQSPYKFLNIVEKQTRRYETLSTSPLNLA